MCSRTESTSFDEAKLGRFMQACSSLSASDRHLEVPPYEEMALYYPQANQRRPLILVGPPSIGRHELRLQLLEDTARFAAAVPRKDSLSPLNEYKVEQRIK